MARSKFLRPSIACFVLVAVLLLPTLYLDDALGVDPPDDTIIIKTDKELLGVEVKYSIGENVEFTVTGFDPAVKYKIEVMRKIESEESTDPIATLDLDEDGIVSWLIPYNAVNGTYVADVASVLVTTVDSEVIEVVGGSLASTEFEIATDVSIALPALTDELEEFASGVTGDSLLASLNNAIKKVESAIALFEADSGSKTAANQLRAARNMLTAFMHKVGAQTGKGIEDEVAADLTEKALEYIRYIDSLIGSTLVPLGKKLALNVERTLAKQEMHMVRFMIRKGLDDAITDEELLSLLNSMEEELTGNLERAKGKMKLLQDLLDSGVITESDYQDLLMQLEEGGNSVNLVKAMADLLYEELGDLEQSKPGLGEHLGQLKQAIKGLVDESETAEESHGELTSAAHSQAEQHGNKGGNDNSGNGKGKDKDKDKDNNGKGKGKDK